MQALREEDPEHEIVVLDIGANIGWYTLALASRGFKVVAFEPWELNMNAFKASLCLNPSLKPFVTLLNYALGEKE
jgi:FkbM family methyltransferase